MALPPSALLCFWYSWLAVAVGSAVHHVLEHFQRPHGLKLSTFSPASAELGGCYWDSLQLVLNSESVSVPQIARCYLSILFVETLGSLVTILLSLLLLRVYVLQRRAVWDMEFGSLWLPDSTTICSKLCIHHAQFLTNKMAGTQKCHNFQVDTLWLFSHHMWLRIPDQNPFKPTAPAKLRSVSPAKWILVVLFFLVAVCGLKTQLLSSISLLLGSQKISTLQSLLALFLRTTRLSLPAFWQWVSALVAVIRSHRFCLLHLKDTSAHGMEWLFTHARFSFCFVLKFSMLRH